MGVEFVILLVFEDSDNRVIAVADVVQWQMLSSSRLCRRDVAM